MATPAPISHRTAEENLGLGYLSAVLQKNGFEVKILDAWLNGWTPKELADKILQDKKPLFVGISAYQSNIDQALKTVDAAKQDKILIERFRHHYDIEYDTRPEKSYNWTYGMEDKIRGRGITFYLRQGTGEYKRIGQYIAIFNDNRLIGCEYGVGIEVLLA